MSIRRAASVCHLRHERAGPRGVPRIMRDGSLRVKALRESSFRDSVAAGHANRAAARALLPSVSRAD